MIAGYAQQGWGQEALTLYSGMQQEGLTLDFVVTFLCHLEACASLAALPVGKQELRAQIMRKTNSTIRSRFCLRSATSARQSQRGFIVTQRLVHRFALYAGKHRPRKFHGVARSKRIVASMGVHVMDWAGREHLRFENWIANVWRVVTSNHAQSLLMVGRRCWRVNPEDPSRLMATTSLQQDFGLIGPALTTGLSPISVLRHMQDLGGFRALSHLASKLWSATSDTSYGEEGKPSKELQEFSWQQYFADPTQWWDNKPTPRARHPDFRHQKSDVALWLNNRHKPAWSDSQLATWDAVMREPTESVSTSVEGQGAFGRLAPHEGYLEVEVCRKLCEDGRITDAVHALSLLVQRGWHVPTSLFYCVLKRCIAHKDLGLGRRIHALTIKSGYEGEAFLATHLIGLYSSHGRTEEAMRVFIKVSTPSSYNWATIIFAYARHGEAAEAIRLYRQMCESTTVNPTHRIYVAVLKACAAAEDLVAGKEVHAHILASPGKPDIFVQTGLVDMYAKCGSLEDARSVFDRLPARNVVTWTVMIAGYARKGMGQEALTLYSSMQQEGLTPPDSVTFVCLLQACASVGVGALHQGKQLHAQIDELGLQDDVVVGNSLVNMYAKCGSLDSAHSMFDKLRARNVVTWNAMIAGYAQQGMGQEALTLYSGMQGEGITPPDSITFVCLLQACASVGVAALHQGKQLHAQIEERGLQANVVVGGSLVNMYAKCGALEDARSMFDRLTDKNVVSWTAMIAGYAQQGMGQEALSLYHGMQQEGITPPDSITFVCLLQACAIVAALSLGKLLHAQIAEQGLQADLVLGGALVNMYAKCGSMFDSQQVFDSLPERTIETWNALTGGYVRQGESEVVFDLVNRMRLEGIQPNGTTFVSVLTVCSHVGLLDKGRKYFEAMRAEYGISPTVEHYTCMMDLLGRAGHLDEALQLAKTMPFPPNSVVWLTLLGACQKWNNVEIGQQAFEFAVSADGKDASSYVLMSNIYARAQMWEEAEEMQARRKQCGAWKQPGQTCWTDMGGVLHTFVVGDKKHLESEGIYARLEQLVPKMKKEGYVPHLHSALRDIPDDEKKVELCGQS